MTKEELIKTLTECAERAKHDPEAAHIFADEGLIEYINDPEIKAAYDSIRPMWYA